MLRRTLGLLTSIGKWRITGVVIAFSFAAAICATEWEPRVVLPVDGGAQSVVWSTNGNLLITGHAGVLKYWQMPEGRYLKTEQGGPLAVLANGEREIAVSMGLGAELRRIDTGEVLHRIELPTDPNHTKWGQWRFLRMVNMPYSPGQSQVTRCG